MLNKALLVIFGALVGGALMYRFTNGVAETATADSVRQAAERDLAANVAQISVAERLSVYTTAASETNLFELESALAAAASAAWSPARDIEIDAWLARLAELAPARAVAVARTLGLELAFMADAYRYWASIDAAAALADLRTLAPASTRREVALVLLEFFGDDAISFERIASTMTPAERATLQIAWYAQRAESEPVRAFRDAQLLTDQDLQTRVMEKIAQVWAAQDPLSALSQADALPDNVKSAYRVAVLHEWAHLDSAGYLAYLEAGNSTPEEAYYGLQFLAAADPERVLAIAAGLNGNAAQFAKGLALNALAEIDIDAAIARANSLPPGQDREVALMAVGGAIARRDPQAALDWARSVTPPSRSLLSEITFSISRNNPELAFELLDNPPPGIDPQMITSLIGSQVIARRPGQMQEFANRLLARENVQSANALRNLMGNWMQQDPEEALDWVLANDASLDASLLSNAAVNLARNDPQAAANYVDRIPEAFKGVWITQVASGYALADPNAAMAWISQYQGQDFYNNAYGQIVIASAQADPRNAASLVAQSDPVLQLRAAPQVAQLYARRDPMGAANWAQSLENPRARDLAIESAISSWANVDVAAATRFTLDLDRGDSRDRALNNLLLRASSNGEFDRDLLDAFSTDEASQQALVRAIPMLSRSDREQANELLELVSNPTERQLVEQQIEEINSLPF